MKLDRTFTITRAADGTAVDENGLIELAISSETPYERWFGVEILSHDTKAVDMSRLTDGRHPLLANHDWDKQIGVITKAWLDKDRVLRGQAKFSRSALGQEYRQDVADGIRTLVSVGYLIEEIEEVDPQDPTKTLRALSGDEFEREMRNQYGDHFARAGLSAQREAGGAPPTYVVTRWQPFEASIVSIPADVTVGVGRSAVAQAAPASKPEAPPTQIEVIKEQAMSDQKTPAQLDDERRSGIIALGEQYKKYVSDKDVADALRNGRTLDQFKDLILSKAESAHVSGAGLAIGMTATEVRRYSLGRALAAAVTGDWKQAGLEMECSRAVEKIMGAAPQGFYVPFEAFNRDFNVGTSSEAGNLVGTYPRPDLFADVLRNRLVFGQAGARVLAGLSGNLTIPRKSASGTIGMLSEIGSASESAPTTNLLTLSPKRMAGYTEVSKQALIQSYMSLEDMIRQDLLDTAAVKAEQQFINGVGSSNEMTGLRNTSGIGTVAGGTNGAAPAWSHFVDLESACANSNAEPDQRAGYILNTKTRGKLKQTQMGTNLPFIWRGGGQPVNDYRAFVTNNVPSNLTKGTSTTVCSAALFSSDWSEAIIALFGAPDITVDPFTKSDTGQVKITLNQFGDIGFRQVAAFSKCEDLLAG